MTTLEAFRKADAKVTRLELTGVNIGEGGKVTCTKEYEAALAEAQALYLELERQGINPFKS